MLKLFFRHIFFVFVFYPGLSVIQGINRTQDTQARQNHCAPYKDSYSSRPRLSKGTSVVVFFQVYDVTILGPRPSTTCVSAVPAG